MTIHQAPLDSSIAAPDAATSTPTTHSLLTRQLELEMQKRRPDHFIIGVICRSIGGVPSSLRSQVWQELLGVARTERLGLDQSILQVEEDLDNQRVIIADAVRTRSNNPRFQAKETVALVVKLLTYYCKCRSIQYKQGMNEVLAPFLLLTERREGSTHETFLANGVLFQCFYALIDRFLPHVFVDQEFRSLQCSLHLFRLLLLYHDPELCHYLDQHDMTPELYVTPWFITLFARSLPPEYVFYLWDFFLVEKDPYLPHFVAYAVVVAHREEILQADIAMLPQVLSSLTFSSREDLERVCAQALVISRLTPKSFKRDLFSVCHGDSTDIMAPFLDHLHARSSLQVYPEELVQNLLDRLAMQTKKTRVWKRTSRGVAMQQEPLRLNPSISPAGDLELLLDSSSSENEEDSEARAIKFILLDCRPAVEYHKSHLSLSLHIDPSIMERPDALDRLMKGFARMKGCHFCFVGPSVDSPSVRSRSLSKKAGLNPITRLANVISNDKSAQEPRRKVNQVPGATEITESVPLLALPSTRPISFGEAGTLASETGRCEVSLLHAEHVSVTRIVLMFLQKGFKYVSRLDGGFNKLEKSIQTMDLFAQEQLLVSSSLPKPVSEPTVDPSDVVRGTSIGGFNLLARIGLNRSRTPSQDELATEGNVSTCSEGSDTTSGQSATKKISSPSVLSAFNNSRSSKRAKYGALIAKTTTTGAVSALSHRLTLLKAAAKDAVSSSSNNINRTNSDTSVELISITDESFSSSEEGWVDVRIQTSNLLEKSEANTFDVELQAGPIGILFRKSCTSRVFEAVVDSVVPDTQASASEVISTGDLLVAINGVNLEGVPFLSVIERIIEASRPVVLRFLPSVDVQRGKANSILKILPLAPTLVCATRHSLCITWDNMPVLVVSPSVARYQIQFAKQLGDKFTSWLPVAMKQEGTTAEVDTTGVTNQTNGTMVGLEPGDSLVFRVRCGDGQQWSPYSLSSCSMRTLKIRSSSLVSGTVIPKPLSSQDIHSAVFLPGVCPEYVERGHFFYRVLLSLQARGRPDFNAERLNIILEKGVVIRGSERVVCPGSNQVFVRLGLEDTNDIVHPCQVYEQERKVTLLRNGHWEADIDTTGIWAFENTPDGDVVLERLSEPGNEENGPSFQHQAKSLVQSFLHSSGLTPSSSIRTASLDDNINCAGSSSSMASSGTSDSHGNIAGMLAYAPAAPHIVQVFAASSWEIVVTWDPVNDADVTKYQIQYAMNRLAAMWWTVKPDIDTDTLKSSVSGLQPNTAYLFRIRSGTNDNKWGPYSEPSERCRTLPSNRKLTNNSSSDDDEKKPHAQEWVSSNDNNLLGMTLMPLACENAPMRTGSTILDKAVAVASRLKRHSNNSQVAGQSCRTTRRNTEKEEMQMRADDGKRDFVSRYVDLSKWKSVSNNAPTDIHFFDAIKLQEQDEDANRQLSHLGPRELALTRSALIVLKVIEATHEGYAQVEARYDLTSLITIVKREDLDHCLVFNFKDQAKMPPESPDQIQPSDQLTVVVDDAMACAQLVQEYHAKVKLEKYLRPC